MENDKGFIKLSRRFFSNIMWNEARTFSSCEAWLDLIQSARFDATPRKECIGGREVFFVEPRELRLFNFLLYEWINFHKFLKYDEYNDVGTTKDAIKGTDINMEINSLKEEWAQLRAQLAAQPMNNNPPQLEFSQK